MSNKSAPATGSYTDFFTSISAADIRVAGLPAGSAGSRGAYNPLLSSLSGAFAIGPDTASMLGQFISKSLPSRPATQANVISGWLAAAA
jgi:hypothetical protein